MDNSFLNNWIFVLAIGSILSFATGQNVEVTNDIQSCLNGGNTLTCKLKEAKHVVRWTHERISDPIALCYTKRSTNTCELNPVYSGKYYVSSNVEKLIFNLTVINENNGSKFVCSDGTHSDCHVINMEECKNSLIYDKEYGSINASSACFSLDTNVSFRWIKIVNEDGSDKEIEFKPKELLKNDLNCSNECGNKQSIQHIESFLAVPKESGRKYILKVEIKYGKEFTLSIQTNSSYSINDQDADVVTGPPSWVIPLVITAVCLIIIIRCVCVWRVSIIQIFRRVAQTVIGRCFLARNRAVVNTHHVEDEEAAIQEGVTSLLSKNVSEKEIDCHQIEDINILTIVDIPMPNLHTTMVDTGATRLYSTEDALSVNIQQ